MYYKIDKNISLIENVYKLLRQEFPIEMVIARINNKIYKSKDTIIINNDKHIYIVRNWYTPWKKTICLTSWSFYLRKMDIYNGKININKFRKLYNG